jgi:ketosteroid isomerase-like protein
MDNRLARRFFEMLSNRDLKEMEKLLSHETVLYFPKTRPITGTERILKFFTVLYRQYPELTFEIRRAIVQEHLAAVHWTNRGLSRKGEPYENEGVTLLEESDGRIIFISDFFKDTGKF